MVSTTDIRSLPMDTPLLVMHDSLSIRIHVCTPPIIWYVQLFCSTPTPKQTAFPPHNLTLATTPLVKHIQVLQ